MKRVINVVFCVVVLTSCALSPEAPSCSGESVTKLVVEITTKEVRDQIFNINMKFGGMISALSYDELKTTKDEPGNEKIKELVLNTDQQVAASKLTLSGIRINGVKNEIKKCECGGNILSASGASIPITYTAQFTEDGKVYVEVFGLK